MAFVLWVWEPSLGSRLHSSQEEAPTAKLSFLNLGLPPMEAGLAPFVSLPFLPVSMWFLAVVDLKFPLQVVFGW